MKQRVAGLRYGPGHGGQRTYEQGGEGATRPAVTPHLLLGPATRSVTRIRGGTGPNTIPGSCEVDIDRRTLPGEDPVAVWHQDRDELTALGTEVDPPFTVDPALDTPPDTPVVTALRAALAAHGRPYDIQGMPFGTDASKLARAGMPSVVFGPGSVTDAHAATESVDLAEVELAARIVVATVRETGRRLHEGPPSSVDVPPLERGGGGSRADVPPLERGGGDSRADVPLREPIRADTPEDAPPQERARSSSGVGIPPQGRPCS
ncbi:M20/M25/M40 family metallo-hydrolase [Streptomyces canus]|uniref:M20/M25/M40 family metallo-hydrolase n=1 Tax=Streptomyces canus TaxID=58343 RepID=UPI0036B0D580